MNYTGIILDVDGTIWNTTEIVAVAWNKAIDLSGIKVPYVTSGILQTQFGKPMDVIFRNLFPMITQEQQDILHKLCCIQEKNFLTANKRNIMYQNVFSTVRDMSENIPFYIVSNCQAGYIELMLEKTGMEKFITDFECFGNTGKGKAENLQLLIERNKIEKPVYIGDTQSDCSECKKTGTPFIWAAYGFGTADSYTGKINNFSELKKIVC